MVESWGTLFVQDFFIKDVKTFLNNTLVNRYAERIFSRTASLKSILGGSFSVVAGSSYRDEKYFEPSWKFLMEHFAKIVNSFELFDYFLKIASSWTFDWVLNTPLNIDLNYCPS